MPSVMPITVGALPPALSTASSLKLAECNFSMLASFVNGCVTPTIVNRKVAGTNLHEEG